MKAEQRFINQVLTEQLQYEIPAYQRPYSWQADNVSDLLEDITEAFERKDREYFIGSLITIERKTNLLYDVVDGQQRLTTLTIVLARLRNAIQNTAAKEQLAKTFLPRNVLTGQSQTPRLQLRKQDRTFFRDYILQENLLPSPKSVERGTAKLNIINAALTVDNFIAGKAESWLMLFANYLLTNVCVVYVQTDTWQSAYRLFNVLNARGLKLSNADLLKNMLFERAVVLNQNTDELEDLWTELEEIIGIDEMDTFLSFHRTTLKADKAEKALSEEYESLLSVGDVGPLSFVKQLISSAQNYERILQSDFDTAKGLRAIRALHRVSFDEWIPALLAFLNRNVIAMEEDFFLDLLERITMQNWIRRLGRTMRNGTYYRLIRAIAQNATSSQVEDIFRQDANNEEFASLLNGDVYGLPGCTAILMGLEEASQDESVMKHYTGMVSVEHVMPQSMRHTYWLNNFTRSEHEELLHKLGNLTLLSGKKNSKAQNYPFAEKKRVYEKKNEKVSFDLTKAVCQVEDWTPEVVRNRQAELTEVGRRLWAL